jgi:UDP-N-acetyl-D-galactosamine dehydrogenase
MKKIAIIGLGYVGLPLAIEFGKKFKTIGYDIKKTRINELKEKLDITNEVSVNDFKQSKKLSFTSSIKDIKDCNIYIVAVPTPKNHLKKPNLKPLIDASKALGKIISNQDIVIFESTVYPGVTDDICAPIIEKISKLKYLNKESNQPGFYCGYSPERINPGDKKNHFTKIKKIVAGSNKKITKKISNLYNQIILSGTHEVSSIKAAEAVKVIENVQRDINIALMNELSIIFNKMNLNTEEILKAAETKWNFLNFRPGLVGGHCIGVDPYYLIHKSTAIGYKPNLIKAGRRVNDNMGYYIAEEVCKLFKKKKIKLNKSRILILGIAYKEDCRDIRNTLVVDIYKKLKKLYNLEVDIFDPIVNKKDVWNEYKIELVDNLKSNYYDGLILAVNHKIFRNMGLKKLIMYAKKKNIIYDIKYAFPAKSVDGRL